MTMTTTNARSRTLPGEHQKTEAFARERANTHYEEAAVARRSVVGK